MTEREKAFMRRIEDILKDSELAMTVTMLVKECHQMNMMEGYLNSVIQGDKVLATNEEIVEEARKISESKIVYLIEDKSGRLHRVPAEKYEEWLEGQAALERGEIPKLTFEEFKAIIERARDEANREAEELGWI